MTKEAYFDMCTALGTTAIEDDIPVSLEDFPVEVQYTFEVYIILRDDNDPMSGNYIGKSMVGIKDIFDILEVPKELRHIVLTLIQLIDSVRRATINKEEEVQKPARP